jgi:hypothetical protein
VINPFSPNVTAFLRISNVIRSCDDIHRDPKSIEWRREVASADSYGFCENCVKTRKNCVKTRFLTIEFGQFVFWAICTAASLVKYRVFESASAFFGGELSSHQGGMFGQLHFPENAKNTGGIWGFAGLASTVHRGHQILH